MKNLFKNLFTKEKLQPTNQKQQVLWYLIYWKTFSVKDVVVDSLFYKFNARLSEIEYKHGAIANKTRKKFTNRFGKSSSYTEYSCVDVEKAKELFELYK